MYDRLGTKYLEDIENAAPPEVHAFMRLIPKGGSVLDVGCAGGRDSKIFVDNGFDLTGVDISEVFLKEASKKIPEGKFLKADVLELPFPDEFFDAVWANAILLHVSKDDIPKALQSVRRVLKREGKLHIRVKEGEGSKEIEETLKNAGEVKRPFTLFQKEELERFVQDAGFTLLSSERLPDDMGRTDVTWLKIWAEKPAT